MGASTFHELGDCMSYTHLSGLLGGLKCIPVSIFIRYQHCQVQFYFLFSLLAQLITYTHGSVLVWLYTCFRRDIRVSRRGFWTFLFQGFQTSINILHFPIYVLRLPFCATLSVGIKLIQPSLTQFYCFQKFNAFLCMSCLHRFCIIPFWFSHYLISWSWVLVFGLLDHCLVFTLRVFSLVIPTFIWTLGFCTFGKVSPALHLLIRTYLGLFTHSHLVLTHQKFVSQLHC